MFSLSPAGFLCSGSWIICEDTRWFCVNTWSFGDSSELFPTRRTFAGDKPTSQVNETLKGVVRGSDQAGHSQFDACPSSFTLFQPSATRCCSEAVCSLQVTAKSRCHPGTTFLWQGGQFLTVETGKTGCRFDAGPELTLELPWWKRGIGPLTRLVH